MAPADRYVQRQRWHNKLCSRFPEVRKLETEQWPTSLALSAEDTFADQSRPEPERLISAERAIPSHYTRGLPAERRQEIEECLAESVRLLVQEDFEQCKTGASVGLVTEDGELALLDEHATVQVVDAIRGSSREQGIKLRVVREM